MFASKTLLEHGARGAVGIGAIISAVLIGQMPGPFAVGASLALAAIALMAFRGCPICWTIGMVETLRNRFWPGGASR